jgi:hypothetical protein
VAALDLPAPEGLVFGSHRHRAAYERIARRIGKYGGEASILETVSPTEAWHERTVSRFNAARDEEYEEVVVGAPAVLKLARGGRTT